MCRNCQGGEREVTEFPLLIHIKERSMRDNLFPLGFINDVSDRKCSVKLMEIPAADFNLDRVIQTCRQVELTNAHLKN